MMKREFNVTGLCVPHKHYMVDISKKINQIKELIDNGHYFVINRARQYGKTTTLSVLRRALESDYIVISLTFEGLGTENFESPSKFCQKFTEYVSKALRFTSETKAYQESWKHAHVADFDLLSEHITHMCENKNLILIIDEVDKISHNQVFIDFLSMLRKKFLARQDNLDFTFHSVILAGVYDIKNLKWKIRERNDQLSKSKERIYHSPWNIAVNFTVDMSFSPERNQNYAG